MQRWAQRNLGPLAIITDLAEQGPKLLSELHRLPQLLKDDGQMTLRLELAKQNNEIRQLQDQLAQMQRTRRRGFFVLVVIVACAAIFGANFAGETGGESGMASLLPLVFSAN